MIDHKKLKTPGEVYDALCTFEICFPHLKEKVSDLRQFACKLSEKAEVYLCCEDGKPLGISCFYCNDLESKTGYITLIGVLPDLQGAGLGKKLLDLTCSVMKDRQMTYVRLEVDNDNFNAKRFYAKHGFKEESTKESSCYMLKSL